MKIRLQNGLGVLKSAFVMATLSAMFACSDNTPGQDSPDSPGNGTLDPIEAYTRAFVKEFGVFKGKPWNEAVSGAITVCTSRPTSINVFAEIDGQRFIFASLGSVNGSQPVMVNIPAEVKELIVSADGREYKVSLGEVLDLSEGSRYYVEPTYTTDDIASLNGFDIVRMPEAYREIGLTGSKIKTWMRIGNDDPGFRIFDADNNFNHATENKLHQLSRFYGSEKGDDLSEFTIYPIYWRDNIYGENDYLLGIYYYDLNEPSTIKMIDLEDFDLKSAISFKKNGANDFTVSQTGEAYNATKLNNFDEAHIKGYHMKTKNINPDGNGVRSRIGFYIKSGLKDGTTPGKGRNYTHISFMNNMYNAIEWGDNYWDTPLSEIRHSYSGAVMCASPCFTLSRDQQTRVDGLPRTYDVLGTDDAKYYIIGFMSQPNERAAATPDYSDVVLAFTHRSATIGTELYNNGETFGTYPWYIASEDLGSTDDWDFNDLIVNVYDLTTDFTRAYVAPRGYYPTPTILGRRITVVPRAAGGTYPIYLMYQGEVSEAPTDETMASAIKSEFKDGTYVVGTELHAWLGEPDYTKMLNTSLDDGYNGGAVSFCIPVIGSDRLDFDIQNPPQNVGITNQTLRNFWVLVDKENAMQAELTNYDFDRQPLDPVYDKNHEKITRHLSQTKNVLKPFNGKLGQGAYRVDPPKETGSNAPQMLMCHYGWKWPVERANIGDVYDQFRDWVAGKRTTWHGNPGAGEGTNGHDPTKICGGDPIVWMQ